MLQTYNSDGAIDTYTYGLQRIDSKGEINETYLYDGRGSVVGAVDNANEFVSYSYTAYGKLLPNSPEPNVFGYNAEATDYDTGLQYLRARYYDATINRFFQEDDYRGDFTSPASMNRYIYVGSNPANRVDPSGYWENPLKKIGKAVSTAFNKFTEKAEETVKKAITQTKETVTGFVNNVKTETTKFISSLSSNAKNLYNKSKEFLQKTKNSITSNINSLAEKTQNLINNVEDIGEEFTERYKENNERISNIINNIGNKNNTYVPMNNDESNYYCSSDDQQDIKQSNAGILGWLLPGWGIALAEPSPVGETVMTGATIVALVPLSVEYTKKCLFVMQL